MNAATAVAGRHLLPPHSPIAFVGIGTPFHMLCVWWCDSEGIEARTHTHTHSLMAAINDLQVNNFARKVHWARERTRTRSKYNFAVRKYAITSVGVVWSFKCLQLFHALVLVHVCVWINCRVDRHACGGQRGDSRYRGVFKPQKTLVSSSYSFQ